MSDNVPFVRREEEQGEDKEGELYFSREGTIAMVLRASGIVKDKHIVNFACACPGVGANI